MQVIETSYAYVPYFFVAALVKSANASLRLNLASSMTPNHIVSHTDRGRDKESSYQHLRPKKSVRTIARTLNPRSGLRSRRSNGL